MLWDDKQDTGAPATLPDELRQPRWHRALVVANENPTLTRCAGCVTILGKDRLLTRAAQNRARLFAVT